MSRFIIKESSTLPNGWVLTDTNNGIVVTFEDGKFNETQKVTILEDVPNPSVGEIARIMRELGDWAVRYHSSKCFTNTYGYEYSEDDNKLYLYRKKFPKWRMEIEDSVDADVLAKTLRNGAEFLIKR